MKTVYPVTRQETQLTPPSARSKAFHDWYRVNSPTLYTIGHSNRSWEAFLGLLQGRKIELVTDVRSRPRSRFPWFTGPRLAAGLHAAGIEYRYLGESLGGQPADPALYHAEGDPDYAAMAARLAYRRGIAVLLGLLGEGRRVALLCSEGDPARCHREHLIGRTVREEGVEVVRIG